MPSQGLLRSPTGFLLRFFPPPQPSARPRSKFSRRVRPAQGMVPSGDTADGKRGIRLEFR